jgi:hypothetical protein
VTSDLLRDVTSQIMDAITAQLAAIRHETPPAQPFDHRQVQHRPRNPRKKA